MRACKFPAFGDASDLCTVLALHIQECPSDVVPENLEALERERGETRAQLAVHCDADAVDYDIYAVARSDFQVLKRQHFDFVFQRLRIATSRNEAACEVHEACSEDRRWNLEMFLNIWLNLGCCQVEELELTFNCQECNLATVYPYNLISSLTTTRKLP